MKTLMKRLVVYVLITVMMLAAIPANAENDLISRILETYPGYKFDAALMSLGTRDYSFSGCIPELEENGCYLYVSASNYDRAPEYMLIVSVGEQKHDFSVLQIMTDSTDYTFTTDNTNDIYSKTFNIPCSPNGKTPNLIQDILASSQVIFHLVSNGNYKDLTFEMSDKQRNLIDLSYQYYIDALKKADTSKLLVKEWFTESVLSYIVTQEPHKANVASNGNGGLFPWCSAYLDERFPGVKQSGDGLDEFLRHIINEANLNVSVDGLYEQLKGLDSKESVYAKLDELVTQNESSSTAASVADELREYKKLLDEGIITQEEFDAKKKQLLGI